MTNEKLHPVFQLMRERRFEKSKPGNRSDGQKLGVVVEGGSLRAVISAAELAALSELGYKDTVDVIYGESVGNGNAVWFASGQMPEAVKTYWTIVNNTSFVNPLRFLTRQPIVDLEHLRKGVEEAFPLNFGAFQDSGIETHILAARADKPSLASFSEFDDKCDLEEVLLSSMQMPFLCGGPHNYKGMPLWDAGVIDKFPIQTAIEDGCTHILAVSSNPFDYIPQSHKPITVLLVKAYFAMHNPNFSDSFLHSKIKFGETLNLLRDKHLEQDGQPFIATLAAPKGTKRLNTFELNNQILMNKANQVMSEVHKILA